MRIKYLNPDIVSMEVIQDDIICTSPSIEPGGSGHDFNWGDDIGITPDGCGNDFNWGN